MSRRKEQEYPAESRIRVSTRGLAFTGTVEQAWEIYDYLATRLVGAPIIVTDFNIQLWKELKAAEGK